MIGVWKNCMKCRNCMFIANRIRYDNYIRRYVDNDDHNDVINKVLTKFIRMNYFKTYFSRNNLSLLMIAHNIIINATIK